MRHIERLSFWIAFLLILIVFSSSFSLIGQNKTEKTHAEHKKSSDVKWKFELNDRGLAWSCAVHEGTLYTGDSKGTFYALSADTGKKKWTFDSGVRITDAPAVAGGNVYFTNFNTLFCLDADTGDLIWESDTPHQGRAISPAISNGRVIYGYKFENVLYCFSAENGELIWKARVKHGPSDDYVIDGDEVFVSTSHKIIALDARTGERKWVKKMDEDEYPAAPCVTRGSVFVAQSDGVTYALDRETGKTRWRKKEESNTPRAPSFHNGVVYIGTLTNIVARKANNGERIWTYNSTTKVNGEQHKEIFSSTSDGGGIAISNGQLFATSAFRGILHAVDIKTGKARWTKELGTTIIQEAPMISEGKLFILRTIHGPKKSPQKGLLYCIRTDLSDSANDWPTKGGNSGRTGTPPEKKDENK